MNGLRLQVSQLTGVLAREHEVTVLAYRWPGQEGAPPPGVELIEVPPPRSGPRARARVLLTAAARRLPAGAVAQGPPMAAAVRSLLAERSFDVAHVTGASLAGIAPALGSLPAVLASLDAWHINRAAVTAAHPPLRRAPYRFEERMVRRFGARAYRPYGSVVFVTRADADEALSLDPTLPVEVIPNGVDAAVYSPAPDPAAAREPDLIVLTGDLRYPPNVQAAQFLAREVLPLVRAQRPGARLALVGRSPAPEVQALAMEIEGVEVTGEVPDVVPWLRCASAYACLMRGGTGIKNKLLEALAAGAPCVATPLAVQGMDVTPGEDVLVGDTAPECADALAGLLGDPDLAARLGAAGRARVVEHHSWEAVAERYVALYGRVGGTLSVPT